MKENYEFDMQDEVDDSSSDDQEKQTQKTDNNDGPKLDIEAIDA